VLPKFAASP
jgi:hypothetical protein